MGHIVNETMEAVLTRDNDEDQDVAPTDRRKQLTYLRNIAKQKSINLLPGVWTYLGRLMEDDTAPHGARLTASNMILDRALGKATEHKEIDVRVDVNAQHLDALKAINTAFRVEAEAQVLEVLEAEVIEEDVLPGNPTSTPACDDDSQAIDNTTQSRTDGQIEYQGVKDK